MVTRFDPMAFSRALRVEIAERNVLMKNVAHDTGLSPSTITRIVRHGQSPNLDAFAALCVWAGFEPERFWVTKE